MAPVIIVVKGFGGQGGRLNGHIEIDAVVCAMLMTVGSTKGTCFWILTVRGGKKTVPGSYCVTKSKDGFLYERALSKNFFPLRGKKLRTGAGAGLV